MSLKPDQALRHELLMKALEMYPNPDEALKAADRMAEFVLKGATAAWPETGTPVEQSLDDDLAGNSEESRRRWSGDEELKLRQLWDQGATIGEIAQILSRSQASVSSRARQLDLPQRKRGRRASNTTANDASNDG